MEHEKYRLYMDESGHAWVGEHWVLRYPAQAVKIAKVPSKDDPRWMQGVPTILDKEVLTLSPFFPSGELNACVEKKNSKPPFDNPNHPPFYGCKAWMTLDKIEWVDAKRQREIDATIWRIKNGAKGDDLPCVMAELGCDYDAACDAVFGEQTDAALALLDEAIKKGPK